MKTEINPADYSAFIITGTDRNGKRFKLTYSNALYAFSINLYKGSVYGVRISDGKRELLKRVVN